MKKLLLTATASVVMVSAASAQTDGDGTITFTGQVTDTTCTASVNGQGATATVTLPTVSVNSLNAQGETAGPTNFAITLTDCSVGGTDAPTIASTYFEQGPSVDANTGRLNNTAGSAQNVQIQLLGRDQETIIPIGNTNTSGPEIDLAQSADGGTLNYYARYFATGQATAGDVRTSVNYTIVYR